MLKLADTELILINPSPSNVNSVAELHTRYTLLFIAFYRSKIDLDRVKIVLFGPNNFVLDQTNEQSRGPKYFNFGNS